MIYIFNLSYKNRFIHIIPEYGWYVDSNEIGKNIFTSKLKRKINYNNYLYQYNICLSSNCNGTCLYCYQNAQTKRKEKNINKEDLFHFIKMMEDINPKLPRNNENKFIELFGGEPLLRKDITDILDYLLEHNYKIKIATNGTLPILHSEEFSKYIKNKNIHFRISLDGHTKDIHEKYRTKNSFDKIIFNIKHLINMNADLSVKTIINDSNFNHLPELLHYLKYTLKIKNWNYNALYNLDSTINNKIKSTITHFDIVTELTNTKYKEYYSMFKQTPLAVMLKNIFIRENYRYRRNYIFLNNNLKLYMNDQLLFDEYSIGTIKNLELDKFKYLLNKIEFKKYCCSKCFAKDYCYLGNYGELYKKDNSLESEFPTCDYLKKCIFYLMSLEKNGLDILKKIYN